MRGGNWDFGTELAGFERGHFALLAWWCFSLLQWLWGQVCESAAYGISYRSHVLLSETGQSFWEVAEI